MALGLQGSPVPEGQILNIIIPAQAAGESEHAIGLLEEETYGNLGGSRAVDLILFHFLERFGTGDFQRRRSVGSHGHLHVSLYG